VIEDSVNSTNFESFKNQVDNKILFFILIKSLKVCQKDI